MIGKSTLPEELRPMMGRPSVRTGRCAVCGRTSPLNQHHVVRRGAGKLFDGAGREVRKPTVTLCGCGNVLHDADGREYCHGLAHANRLHFRWAEPERRTKAGRLKADQPPAGSGHWEYLLTGEPVKYSDALKMGGWRPLRAPEEPRTFGRLA